MYICNAIFIYIYETALKFGSINNSPSIGAKSYILVIDRCLFGDYLWILCDLLVQSLNGQLWVTQCFYVVVVAVVIVATEEVAVIVYP